MFRSEINGTVRAPASKSSMIRAIAIAHLAKENLVIHHPSYCDDAQMALMAAETIGSRFQKSNEKVIHVGTSKVNDAEINCGESGLTIRLFPPIAALQEGHFVFHAEGSLRKRPLHMMAKPLQILGLRVDLQDGYAPLEINGQLVGGEIEVDGSQSSQFLSGLLMSLPLTKENSIIKVDNLKSLPYIDMTLEMMARQGVIVQNNDYKEFIIEGGQQYLGIDETIEGDWSGASFFLVAGALGGRAKVMGLNLHSKQADRQILDALKQAGAKITLNKDFIEVERNDLKPIDMDITHCPDLAPPLVALAANCNGASRLKGADRLIVKESNRAAALQSEFLKLGIDIRLEGDEMIIKGGKIRGVRIDSYGDHRMAMVAAIASIRAEGPVELLNPDCISKSYPDFFKDFNIIGGITK